MRNEDAVPIVAIFVFAFSVRLLYLFQIQAVPLFYHLAADGRQYDEWAQRIAAGDWLGQGVFYQAPLYPYFLGLLQSIVGHDLWSIRVAQIILGAASCSLLYLVGRRFFSREAGIAAGLILSLYAPALFFDGLIQKAVLDLFLITLLLLLLGRAKGGAHWSHWAAIGAVLALLGLSRENALIWLFAPPLWIWLHFSAERPWRRLAWVTIFLLGFTLALLPVGLRNLKVGGEFKLTTSQLGTNFFIGNNPAADGTYLPLRGGHSDPQFERQDATELAEQALGRSLSPGEVSSYWLQRSWDYIRSQPIDWLWLMGRKWLILWNVREIEDADDFYLYQRWSWLLRVLGWVSHFGILAPLAAVGIVMTSRQWRQLWLLYLLIGTLAFSVALFYVFGRYRFPLVPLLAIFAAAGVVEGFALFREWKVRRGLACAAVLLLAVAVVHLPLIGNAAPSAAGYNNLGNALAKQGSIDQAVEAYQQALQVEPRYAPAHYNLGNLFARQGKLNEAMHHYQEAVRILPDFAEAHNNLGNVLAKRDELEEAIQHFRRALELSPGRSGIHLNMANALARQGRLNEAIDHFREALKIKPDLVEAHDQLGSVLAAQGHLDMAIDHFRQALRIQPEFAEAHESLGRALALQGKRDEAIKHYQEALRIMKSHPEASTAR
ncbi:MAG: tetratricopeptide repeat protein [Candidatus Binatia bacterium]